MDLEQLKGLQEEVSGQSKYIDELVGMIMVDYCGDIDKYIETVYNKLIVQRTDPTDAELNDIVIKIPLYLYYNSTVQERLGAQEDLAKLIKDDLHHKHLLTATGTVHEKLAKADSAVFEQKVLHTAYMRAYKQVQQRQSLALELLNSAKKIQNVRISERELAGRR